MEVFNKRKDLFDVEAFKGKNQSNISDAKTAILSCNSKKLGDFKFKKMVQKYRPDQIMMQFFNEEEVQKEKRSTSRQDAWMSSQSCYNLQRYQKKLKEGAIESENSFSQPSQKSSNAFSSYCNNMYVKAASKGISSKKLGIKNNMRPNSAMWGPNRNMLSRNLKEEQERKTTSNQAKNLVSTAYTDFNKGQVFGKKVQR